MPDWRAFVDESGKFQDQDQPVLVAAVLFRSASFIPRELEQAFRDILPDVPWPHHWAHNNLLVTFPLARYVRAHQEGPLHNPVGFDELAQRTVEYLNSPCAHEDCNQPVTEKTAKTVAWERVRQSFDRSSTPSFESLEILDKCVKWGNPSLYTKLKNYGRWKRALIARYLSDFGQSLNAMHVSIYSAAVVAATESCLGDAVPKTTPEELGQFPLHLLQSLYDTERYATLLRCVVERMCDVLCGLNGSHSLSLQVLPKPVFDSGLHQIVRLSRHHLEAILERVCKCQRVELHIEEPPPRYDHPRTNGALVLADYSANRARWHLPHNSPLATVEEQLADIGITPDLTRSGTPALSHLAASGWARERINAARQHEPPPQLGQQVLTWAREQAEEWAREFEA